MGSDDFCVYVLIANVRVKLVSRTKRSENGERGSKRNKTCLCHTGSNTEHILLSDTDVENTVGASIREVCKLGGGCKVSCNSNDFLVFLCKSGKSFAVDFGG